MRISDTAAERMNMRTLALGAFAAVAVLCAPVAPPVEAQTPVDRTVSTPPTGSVAINNVAGEIRVVGWDRPDVRVTGTLGEGTERLDIETSGDQVEVAVVIPRGARNVRPSRIEVRVPARKGIQALGVSASVDVRGVTGDVEVRSTSGAVVVRGNPASVEATSTSGDVDVEVSTGAVEANSTSGRVRVAGSIRESVTAESVSGSVEIEAQTQEVVAQSVSGHVRISAPVRRLSASTVSGNVEVRGGTLQYGAFESVSGSVMVAGNLERDAAINVQSHSGDVTLQLPASVGARFEVSTFSGDIENSFGQAPQRTSRYTPGQELRFTSGDGNALITIKTFSGQVSLQRR